MLRMRHEAATKARELQEVTFPYRVSLVFEFSSLLVGQFEKNVKT